MAEEAKVSDLGESGLLARIGERLPQPPPGQIWFGDDAAVTEAASLIAVDTLVEGLDFDTSYATGADVGWKAVAVNVSDIAAMGGGCVACVTSLTVPPETGVGFVDDLVTGLLEACERWDLAPVGGDISGGPSVVVTVTVTGRSPARTLRRSGVRPGDVIAVTGALGGAAGGLSILREGSRGRSDAHGRLSLRQLRPTARLAEGSIIAAGGATAAIDLSDGLVVDLIKLLDASDVGCEIDPEAVPVDPDLERCGIREPRKAALFGGEDFELLFTCSPESFGEITASLEAAGTRCSELGRVTETGRTLGGRDLDEMKSEGWEHLR